MARSLPSKRRITVGWMASGFVGRPASGTAYVSWKIIEHFLNEYRDEFEVVLFTKNKNETNQAYSNNDLRNAKIIELPFVKGNLFKGFRQYFKYTKVNQERIDFLFFSVSRVYPFYWKFPAKKFISIFHAGGDITVKGEKFVLSKHIYNFINKWQWKRFDAIIAVSEFGKDEIVKNYGIARAAVRVIPNGVDSFLQESPKQPHQIAEESPFVAIIGRWQGFKNVEFACKVMRTLNIEAKKTTKIVLVGRSNVYGRDKVLKEIQRHPVGQLIAIEYLEPEELVWIYKNAQLVIIPSLNEGFGMPSFEAYASGARIVVHTGTPASKLLDRQKGVFSCDMQDFEKSLMMFRRLLGKQDDIDTQERYYFALDNNLLWSDVARKYADLIREQSWY